MKNKITNKKKTESLKLTGISGRAVKNLNNEKNEITKK